MCPQGLISLNFIDPKKGNKMKNKNTTEVTIVDVKMPFMSMVVFLVKSAIAAIPAFIILAIIGAVFTSVVGGMLGLW